MVQKTIEGDKLGRGDRGLSGEDCGYTAIVAGWPQLGFTFPVVVPCYHRVGGETVVNGGPIPEIETLESAEVPS
ncbi:MAG: hypothetical protein DWH80_00005 [Planctomycetota bacterium]|nr:MAG: hypothetical protein DWH80_00005 [Planctomycetota bacterium]